MSDLMQLSADITNKSKTVEMLVDLIKPVMIMMIYVRAERESDWPSHIAAVEQMLPYMIAPGQMHVMVYIIWEICRLWH